MFRKMLTSHVAPVALAAGFATALAAPAGAAVCNEDVGTYNFDLQDGSEANPYVTCTIDFHDIDGSGNTRALQLELWGEYGSPGGRATAISGAAGQYQYNVFGTPVDVSGPTVGTTSESADLIVLSATEGQGLSGGFGTAGFGVGTSGFDPAATISNNRRLEFRFQDPTGGRNDEDGGYDLAEDVLLTHIQLVSYRVGQSFAIEAFDAGDQSTGIVNLVTTAGLEADDATVATAANAEVATYELRLTGVRFQIVGTQLAATGGPDGGAAGNGLYGVRVSGATFVSGIPLPGALIPALTGLAAIGGLAARRRRQKAA